MNAVRLPVLAFEARDIRRENLTKRVDHLENCIAVLLDAIELRHDSRHTEEEIEASFDLAAALVRTAFPNIGLRLDTQRAALFALSLPA